MKKNKLFIVLILLSFGVLIFTFINMRKNLDPFLKKVSQKWPKHINIPKDYLQLFHINRKDIKNITSLKYDNSYPISFIKINRMEGLVTKFNISNDLRVSFIIKNTIKQTPGIWYEDYTTKDLTICFNKPHKPIKEIIVLGNNIDTILYGNKSTILKGNLKKIGIALVEFNENIENLKDFKLNLYFEDRRVFSSLKDDIKYYLVLKKDNEIIYFIFLESKDFDDKKIISLFE